MSVLDRIGDYRIIGTLGSGGQGVVHLGESPSGERVAIKVLHRVSDPQAAARFLREARVLPQVASFCAAQVLGTGSENGLPYIVSEYIDGPTLQASVRERGPIGGRELRRLAVGTITALAAIHRAGVVHRDFKPANVLLSREGPRVIDFGIARTTSGETTIGGVVGTPAYMAPEQFGESLAGPPADLFAWAATIVFAATGRAPFGQDSVPAIMRRLTSEEPDLGGLDGDLREIVAVCLAKDPAGRPRASQVLLRLLGHPAQQSQAGPRGGGPEHRQDSVPERVLLEGQEVARRPRSRGRALVVAGVALAVAASVTAGVLFTREAPQPAPRTRPSPAAVTPSFQWSGAPAADVVEVAVPQLKATFFESPSDPIRLTSFVAQETSLRMPAFARKPGTTEFLRLPQYRDPVVSPDGALIASVYSSPRYAPDNNNVVLFSDRSLATAFTVSTVELPLLVKRPGWSADGSKVLLTVTDLDGKVTGFALVDVAARTTAYVEVAGLNKQSVFAWGPGRTLYLATGGPVRMYSLDGRLLSTAKGVRGSEKIAAEIRGKLLAGACEGEPRAVCVVGHETGKRAARFPLTATQKMWGWFNADHLLVYDDGVSPATVTIVDLTGKRVRPFAAIGTGKDTFWRLFWNTG